MKIISGLGTLLAGLIVAGFGLQGGNWLLIGLGLIVLYTGYRVLKSKPS